jgi:hypothetical protein
MTMSQTFQDDEVAQDEKEPLLFRSAKTKWMKYLQYGADVESGFQIVDFEKR